ncbi:DDE-type integrase/transposase/recombinase [Paenibacillus peoriae]|uniref:DDE-type integrase/transposase/recombinase n=1 Tax=Paenibacillus peoriae TaxID=59893 RepID=UPI00215A91D4|nr:DDE-type integrase/transposase/recombinase [Paenibacillus peoriae]
MPLCKLVTCIIYLPSGGKILYFSSTLKLYTGEIAAYGIADKQDTSFVLVTLNQLPERASIPFHSDQDSAYTSQVYPAVGKGKGITMSMSRKGAPTDHPPISRESHV